MQKALAKSNTELSEWRQKYEEEAVVKNGQLEESNKELSNDLAKLGDEMLAAKSKVSDLEKLRKVLKYDFRFFNLSVSKSVMKMTLLTWLLIWKLFNVRQPAWTRSKELTISLSKKPSRRKLKLWRPGKRFRLRTMICPRSSNAWNAIWMTPALL